MTSRFSPILLLLLWMTGSCSGIPSQSTETDKNMQGKVVLLHGLKRSSWSMRKIARALDQDGYQVCNVDYPSGREQVGVLIDHILDSINSCFADPDEELNFVSHSLGGIMIRSIQLSGRGPLIKRVVMLAPPNHGSEIVDVHSTSRLFRSLMGPVATSLGTEAGSLPLRLGPATFEAGIIAGTGRSNPLGPWIFDEPNDGTVSVASTRLEGMADFIEVPYGHTFIMRKQPVIDEIRHFLAFSKEKSHGRL